MNFLFDLDGTIVDSAEAVRFSLFHALKQFGVEFDSGVSSTLLIGPPLMQTLSGTFGLVSPLLEQVAAEYRTHHSEHGVGNYNVYEGIDVLLKNLGAKHRIFVATAKTEFLARKSVEVLGLNESFEAVYGVNAKRENKTQVISDLMKDFGLLPNATVMIGDKAADGEGAKNNSILFWAVDWGYSTLTEFNSVDHDRRFETVAMLGSHLTGLA